MRRNDREEPPRGDRRPQVGQDDVQIDWFAAEVPVEQRLVLGLLDDRLDQRVPVLLDDLGFGFVRLARGRLAAAIVGDAATQEVDRTDDVTILDQRCAERPGPSPNTRRQRAIDSSKSARDCSSLVTAIARGMFVVSHSRHSSRVASSISSLADTTNSTASAARSPARTSPTKSGLPGVSSRLMIDVTAAMEAAPSDCDGAGSPRTCRAGVRAAISPFEERALTYASRSDEHHVADVFRRLRSVLAARIGSIAHASPFPITPLRMPHACGVQTLPPTRHARVPATLRCNRE